MARTKKSVPEENQVSLIETAGVVVEAASEEVAPEATDASVAESASNTPVEGAPDPAAPAGESQERTQAPEKGDTGDTEFHSPENAESETKEDETISLSLSLPKSMFDQSPGSLNRLHAAIASKQTLLKRAIGTNNLEFFIDDDRVVFPWFTLSDDSIAETDAYSKLVLALAKKAITQSRVSSEEKVFEDERQGMRLYLINLDFKGDEYKTARSVLMKNFAPSSGGSVRNTEFVFTMPEVYVPKTKSENKTDEK